MVTRKIVGLVVAILIGHFCPSAYSQDVVFCNGFESCPSGLPSDINPAYLNTIIKDASGRILGSGPTGEIINEKGYVFAISRPTGLLSGTDSVYFDTPDCIGPGFVSGYHFGGWVFSTTDKDGGFDIRYTKKQIGPVYLSQTYKIINHGTSSACIDAGTIGNYFPAFFNDPETTGVPGNLGSVEDPYPVPLSYHRYGAD